MILRATGLRCRYGDVVALDGLDLSAGAGEIVGLLGPNGAGKSTTFRLLAGLELPTEGSVELGGRDVTRWPLHRRARAGLGYLPQGPSVLPRLTAADNVAIALEARGRRRGDAHPLLAAAGLGQLSDRRAGTLSGGERRRVEIVRALALEPAVLLLDEPFSGVDPVHVDALQAAIRGVRDRGVAVVLTDHAVREALPLCDRALLLDAGRVLVEGPPAAIAADPLARSRYLGANLASDLVKGLSGRVDGL
jgi:lipopolysaccharide export system ATP-binding protein